MRFSYTFLFLLLLCSETIAQNLHDFNLIKNGKLAPLYYNGSDQIVENAIDIFAGDCQSVTDNNIVQLDGVENGAIVVVNLGEEPQAQFEGVDLSAIKDRWEAFLISTTNIDGKNCLLLAGSDSRATAFAILELSRMMGVSPWCWWADVVPAKKQELTINLAQPIIEMPSVQYRGIFLNDEDWALMPWSSKTFEQESNKGVIGPRTYSKIFELLLRLKANTIWPAMHECTVPFYLVRGNREASEKYGIIVGTSHCEPMMRCSASEWQSSVYGAYNYVANSDNVNKYWGERVGELANGKSENIFTLGMRGVHDSRMQGVETIDQETQVLNTVIEDQRKMLARYYGEQSSQIPQIFVPYKEVLKAYDNGLKLPDDVTTMWCDDNHGYITRLSNAQEQKRQGGAGVYYHISYWGKPHDYLWLASTSPGLIYREMKRAWDYGAQKIWILNVGDIKPSEYLTNFFLDLAWDINSISPSSIKAHRQEWIAQNFDPQYNNEIETILNEYYTLSAARKPEHLGWNRVEANKEQSAVHDSQLNPFVFGDEIESRLSAYQNIANISNEIYSKLPKNQRAAYFQLVHYPVVASCAMNEKMFYAQKARLFASHGFGAAKQYAELSQSAHNQIASLTYTYNKDMLGGKWDGMMDFKPRDLPVFQDPVLPASSIAKQNSNKLFAWVENDSVPSCNVDKLELPAFTSPVSESYFVSFFSSDGSAVDCKVVSLPKYINAVVADNTVVGEQKVVFEFNPQLYSNTSENIELEVNGKSVNINVNVNNVDLIDSDLALESNQKVVFDINKANGQMHENLGHSASARLIKVGDKSGVRFDFQTHSVGDALLYLATVPQHTANNGELRYSVSIDGSSPQIVSLKVPFLSGKWFDNTLRNQSLSISSHKLTKAGKHTVEVVFLDEPIALDQMMLDFDTDRKFYSIPSH